MIEKVVELIDRYSVIHGESPLLVSLHLHDWKQLYQECGLSDNYPPVTDPDFYKGNILIHGIPVVRCSAVERL